MKQGVLLVSILAATLLGCSARGVLGPSAARTLPLAPPADRPTSVLLILTDDQGYGDLRLHGNPYLRTPNLDRLALDGARHERFFVQPVCAPTRASLLTGRYHLRTGTWGVTHGRETMATEEVTLGEAFQAEGYRTALFGKWHNGEHHPYTPPAQGFDTFLGFHNGHWNTYFDTWLEWGADSVDTAGYLPDVITEAALDFIEGAEETPFLAVVSYNTPHSPFQVPDRYFDRYVSQGLDAKNAAVYGMVENIDDNVGRLLEGLERMGRAEETIVVFLTDNGPNGGDRYNAGLRGAKGSVFEGGVRVPLFVRWTGHIPAGIRLASPAHAIDVLPTLLDLAGVPARSTSRPLDGRSMAAALRGEPAARPDRVLYFHWNADGDPHPGAARDERYKALHDGRRWRLFDLLRDPAEQYDVSALHPEVLEWLVASYERWFADVAGPETFDVPPIPVGHVEEDPVVLPAPQARLQGATFAEGQGWANSWIVWGEAGGHGTWTVDVVGAGRYRATLRYLLEEGAAGSPARLSVWPAGASPPSPNLEVRLAPTAAPVPLPSPDRIPRKEVYEMDWATVEVGTLRLDHGSHELRVELPQGRRDGEVLLKAVVLERVEG